MDGKKCLKWEKGDLKDKFFECGSCGNHVCAEKAELWSRVCPFCFGRLYRIS